MKPYHANIAACLVHDIFECIVDLLQNIRHFSPGSLILLYNGGRDPRLIPPDFPLEEFNAVLHPESKPMSWGRLHEFAFDCIHYAVEHYRFASLTIVDSDQLLVRHGYAELMEEFFAARPEVGVLATNNKRIVQTDQFGPARSALDEIDLWRPLLQRFEGGEDRFVYWSFWPATTLSYAACCDLDRVFRTDAQLQRILAETRIVATEEVVFPTLVALLGYEVETNPCSSRYVRFRVNFTPDDLNAAQGMLADTYWVHPVPRRYDDPTRRALRFRSGFYKASRENPRYRRSPDPLSAKPHAQAAPIITLQRSVEGWLEEEEAALLIAAVERLGAAVSPRPLSLVEVGGYCGKTTVVLGMALQLSGTRGRISTVDPFDGKIGAHDGTITQGKSTFDTFLQTITRAGLDAVVRPIKQPSHKVEWSEPVDLLLIDHFHDYPNVARDFHQFRKHLAPQALVAFHDYAPYFPGVQAFVDELLARGDYRLVGRAGTLVLLEAARAAPLLPREEAASAACDGRVPVLAAG